MVRAIVFIDGNNLHEGLKESFGIDRLDLDPFCKHIIKDNELRGIYYGDSNFVTSYGTSSMQKQLSAITYAQQQSYFNHIRKIPGLRFREGYYNTCKRVPIEKLVDVYLATDMVNLCYKDAFDWAYLVSGDADLYPAVDIVISRGKRVTNVYFDNKARNSYALRSHCQGRFKNITRKIAEEFKWEYEEKTAEPVDPAETINRSDL